MPADITSKLMMLDILKTHWEQKKISLENYDMRRYTLIIELKSLLLTHIYNKIWSSLYDYIKETDVIEQIIVAWEDSIKIFIDDFVASSQNQNIILTKYKKELKLLIIDLIKKIKLDLFKVFNDPPNFIGENVIYTLSEPKATDKSLMDKAERITGGDRCAKLFYLIKFADICHISDFATKLISLNISELDKLRVQKYSEILTLPSWNDFLIRSEDIIMITQLYGLCVPEMVKYNKMWHRFIAFVEDIESQTFPNMDLSGILILALWINLNPTISSNDIRSFIVKMGLSSYINGQLSIPLVDFFEPGYWSCRSSDELIDDFGVKIIGLAPNYRLSDFY